MNLLAWNKSCISLLSTIASSFRKPGDALRFIGQDLTGRRGPEMQHSLLNNPSRRIKVALATAPTVTTSLKAALLLFNGSFRAPTSFWKAGKLRCLHLEKVKLVAEGQHQSYYSKMMEKISTWESYDVELEKTLLPKYCLQPMRSFRHAPVLSSALPWGIHRFP